MNVVFIKARDHGYILLLFYFLASGFRQRRLSFIQLCITSWHLTFYCQPENYFSCQTFPVPVFPPTDNVYIVLAFFPPKIHKYEERTLTLGPTHSSVAEPFYVRMREK